MHSDLFAPSHQETEPTQRGMVRQNSKMLKVALDGEVLARQGSMVAYQGQVQPSEELPDSMGSDEAGGGGLLGGLMGR